jgi:ankyrin repeat protein
MAATGMGGGTAWVQPRRVESEDKMLEAVKLAVELGVNLNIVNSDGRTALDSARALKYETVVSYLESRNR